MSSPEPEEAQLVGRIVELSAVAERSSKEAAPWSVEGQEGDEVVPFGARRGQQRAVQARSVQRAQGPYGVDPPAGFETAGEPLACVLRRLADLAEPPFRHPERGRQAVPRLEHPGPPVGK